MSKLNQTQLGDLVAQRTGLTRAQSRRAVRTLLAAVVSALQDGQPVILPGLGRFRVAPTPARTGVRPATGEVIRIPAGKKILFRADPGLWEEP